MRKRVLTPFRQYRVQVVVLALTWLIFALTTPLFQGSDGVYSVLLAFPALGLIALGISITMMAGELDLSVTAVAVVAGVLAVKTSSAGLVPAILLATAAGTLFGCLQGWFVARFRINSLIVTVGTLVMMNGLGFVLCHGAPLNVSELSVTDPLLERWGSFLAPDIVVALVVFVIVGVFLARTRYGRELHAIGGARNEAVTAGVPLRRTVMIAFAMSAGLASLAGALSALKAGSIAPEAYESLLLKSITAALVGGISLSGGRGTALNVGLGVAILSLLSAGLSSNAASDATIQLITGVVLLIVVVLEFATALAARRVPGGPLAKSRLRRLVGPASP